MVVLICSLPAPGEKVPSRREQVSDSSPRRFPKAVASCSRPFGVPRFWYWNDGRHPVLPRDSLEPRLCFPLLCSAELLRPSRRSKTSATHTRCESLADERSCFSSLSSLTSQALRLLQVYHHRAPPPPGANVPSCLCCPPPPLWPLRRSCQTMRRGHSTTDLERRVSRAQPGVAQGW